MRFFEINEIWAWCADRGIALEQEARPAADPRLSHAARVKYADGDRSGREPAVAAACVAALPPWDECLLWVTLVGVWSSTEDWPTYYAMRGEQGERRSLDIAPGHWFGADGQEQLVAFLTRVLENGWDAYVLPSWRGSRTAARVRVSHDEWVELQSETSVEFVPPAV